MFYGEVPQALKWHEGLTSKNRIGEHPNTLISPTPHVEHHKISQACHFLNHRGLLARWYHWHWTTRGKMINFATKRVVCTLESWKRIVSQCLIQNETKLSQIIVWNSAISPCAANCRERGRRSAVVWANRTGKRSDGSLCGVKGRWMCCCFMLFPWWFEGNDGIHFWINHHQLFTIDIAGDNTSCQCCWWFCAIVSLFHYYEPVLAIISHI